MAGKITDKIVEDVKKIPEITTISYDLLFGIDNNDLNDIPQAKNILIGSVIEKIPDAKKILNIDPIFVNLQEMEKGTGEINNFDQLENIKNEYAQLSILLGLGFKLSGTKLEAYDEWKNRSPKNDFFTKIAQLFKEEKRLRGEERLRELEKSVEETAKAAEARTQSAIKRRQFAEEAERVAAARTQAIIKQKEELKQLGREPPSGEIYEPHEGEGEGEGEPHVGGKMRGGVNSALENILNKWLEAIRESGILTSTSSVSHPKSFGIFKQANLTRPFNRIQGYTLRQGPSLFGRSFADYGKIVNDMGGLKGGFFNGGGIAPFGKNAFLPKHYESNVMLGGADQDETPYYTLVNDIYDQTIKQLSNAGFKLKDGDAESMKSRLELLKKSEKEYLDAMKKIAEFTKDVNVTGTKNGLDLGVEQMAEIERKFKEFSKEQRRIEHPFDKMFGILRTRPIKESDDKFKELIDEKNKNKIASLLS